jgi:hypothetical protein
MWVIKARNINDDGSGVTLMMDTMLLLRRL